MNLYVFTSIIAFLVSLVLAFLVLFSGKRDPKRNTFIPVTLLVGVWCLFPTVAAFSSDPQYSLVYIRIVYMAALFAVPAFLNFGLAMAEVEERKFEKFLIKTCYFAAALFIPALFTPLMIEGVKKYLPNFVIVPGPVFLFFVFFFAVFCSYAFYSLYRVFSVSNGYRKNQIRYVFIGFFIAFISGFIHFGSFYGLPEVFPHDILVIACMLVLFYAIVQYRLLDINIIIRETAVFAGIFGFAVGAFVFVMYLGQTFLDKYFSHYPFLFPALALFLVTIAVRPIEKLTYNTIGKFLFKKKQRYQKVLKDAAMGMATILRPERLLGLITHIVTKNLKTTNVAIYIFDERTKTYKLQAARYPSRMDKTIEFSDEDPLIFWLKENKQAIVVDELEHWIKEEKSRPHKEILASDLVRIYDKLSALGANICIPSFFREGRRSKKAKFEQGLLGIIILGDKTDGDLYAQDDLELLNSLANEAAIAIRNSILYAKLQQKVEEILDLYAKEQSVFMNAASAFANAIDARDPYTHGHSQRVTEYALALADQMEHTRFGDKKQHQHFKQRLQIAGLLHDIGKIAVPDNILQKTEPLNDEEWKKMREHPTIGAKVLSYVRGLWDIIPAVKHHHERYDGNGYPDKLKQEDIPFKARIIVVADTFDAMTSNRPYRKALSLEESKQEINDNSAKQFDPVVVGAFMKADAKGLIAKVMEQSK
ncbi:MAG: HD domain-containing phosphohydrolase [Candidatus Omnitrophota bacterium]